MVILCFCLLVPQSKQLLAEEAMEMAASISNVSKQLEGKDIKKIIFVQDKILNIVAK